jgi:hypothetical protein
MKLKKGIFFLSFFLLCLPVFADEGWRYVSPMPHPRYGHDATLGHDGRIYVMGGFVWYTRQGLYSNLAYDPRNDTWTYLEPVPGWYQDPNVFMFLDAEAGFWRYAHKQNGKDGYYRVQKLGTKEYEIKRISSDKLRNTNVERQGDGVAIVTAKDGLIYWTGGNGKGRGHGENLVLPYDPVNKKWPEAVPKRVYRSPFASGNLTVFKTNVPPMLDRRIDHEAVVTTDGKIYVMGGRKYGRVKDQYGNIAGTEGHVLDTVECYDPEKNAWEYVKPMSSSRFLFAAVVGRDDKIYVFGGASKQGESGASGVLSAVEVYDPKTNGWSFRKPMPEARDSHAGVLAADGKIYLLGGSAGGLNPPLRDILIYDPAGDTWKHGPPMNLPRSTLAAVATPEGKIYAIGGTDAGAYENRKLLNVFLPEKAELYTGQVQSTVEVLDIYQLK